MSKLPNKALRRAESGNAFYMILIGIFLFAALMFVFSKSMRQGAGTMTGKQTEMAADAVMDYAQALDRAVSRVIGNNCSESQISFENLIDTDYPANPDAPGDKSCNIFDPAGGALAPIKPDAIATGIKIRPSGGSSLKNIGTYDAVAAAGHQDMVVWFGPLSEDVCNKLNTMNSYTGTAPTVASVEAWEYGALVAASHWGTTIVDLGALSGKNDGCVNIPSSGQDAAHLAPGYQFYHVLMAR